MSIRVGLLEITKGLNRDGLKTRKNYEWSKTTVHKILKNEAYTGVLLWGKNLQTLMVIIYLIYG